MPFDPVQNKLNLTKKLIPNLVHSIRNPLSVLKLNHYFINLNRHKLPKEIAASIDDCTKAAQVMEKYLDKFSQLYANASENSCSLNEVVSTAADILEISARRKNMKLIKELHEDIPRLYIEKAKLLQLIVHLILNLIENDSTGKKISLSTSYNDDKLLLELRSDDFNENSDSQGFIREFKNDLLGGGSNILLEFIQNSGIKISFDINKPEGTLIEIQDTDCG